MSLYWIDINYACFGIETDAMGTIIDAPPIAQWMLGRNIIFIMAWVKKKKGKMKVKKGE